mmetsp:Transcript_38698/g.67177  ORF Transcript_38698/g.67177 Transcript_38698/m.67177 type:complete len:92 (-) Transcript_38698:5-280(-)
MTESTTAKKGRLTRGLSWATQSKVSTGANSIRLDDDSSDDDDEAGLTSRTPKSTRSLGSRRQKGPTTMADMFLSGQEWEEAKDVQKDEKKK